MPSTDKEKSLLLVPKIVRNSQALLKKQIFKFVYLIKGEFITGSNTSPVIDSEIHS